MHEFAAPDVSGGDEDLVVDVDEVSSTDDKTRSSRFQQTMTIDETAPRQCPP
jgi:hypothetical protein